MFDHVTIRVGDRAESERLYEHVLDTLGHALTRRGEVYAEWGDFSLAAATGEHPVTRGLHIGFRAASRAEVDRFWEAGRAAGLRDDGAPGPRPEYGGDYYGSFLLDPDGNSIEAVTYTGMASSGCVDHLWVRVAEVAASARFYELVARFAGFTTEERPGRVQFAGDGSFSVVEGGPTENMHMAFPAPDRGTVDAFHGALIDAGYRDNGGPGERLEYHRGYYGAFVLDPDGNNVELVLHS